MSWLIRVCTFLVVAVEVFGHGGGPGAALRAASVAGFAVCGVMALGWAWIGRGRARGGPDRVVPLWWMLGVLAATSGALSVFHDHGTMIALAALTVVEAGSEPRLAVGWSVAGAGVAAMVSAGVAFGAGRDRVLGFTVVVLIALLYGANRRAFRVQAIQARRLLEQSELLRAEREHSAVLAERARLAREIHDVLAHSLGALAVQVQAAKALVEAGQDPVRVAELLSGAQRMASDGLAETRRAVHALRADGDLDLTGELARLAETHERRHEVAVRLRVGGEPAAVPAEHVLCLLRVVQEALVNTAKHAPGRDVELSLDHGPKALTVTVGNPLGPGAAASGGLSTVDSGYGLTGMRERLTLLQGTLDAGPIDGRWVVVATLPHRAQEPLARDTSARP
ncbi:histidine kinase [Kitasatospora sp. NPDC004669]|uniref:sensor histidine kinase n=1 Tax=Kitasatospora sp. NPDC004669 TaxID=3154555 RepID=UPI0033B770DA